MKTEKGLRRDARKLKHSDGSPRYPFTPKPSTPRSRKRSAVRRARSQRAAARRGD